MNLLPRTLIGRTSFYLGLLLLLSNLVWFVGSGHLVLEPLGEGFARQIVDTVIAVREIVEARRPAEAGAPLPSSLAGYRLVADARAPAVVAPGKREGFLWMVRYRLSRELGPSVEVAKDRDEPWLFWVRFPTSRGRFWLGFPPPRPPNLATAAVLWVSIWLTATVVGAYLIIFHLTRRLRTVARAARAVGRGELTPDLAETGPQEIRDLSAAVNQTAADLRKLDSDRRLMLAGISHDLRTPLTRVRIAVEMLGSADHAIASGMVQDIEDMDSILRQFLDYARDGREEQPRTCDLNAIAEEVCRRHTDRGFPIARDWGQVPPFAIRPMAIRRAVANLVDNAVRYGRKGVAVSTRSDGSNALLTVSDLGSGLPGAPAEFVKPFVRGSASREETGAGLGLTIVDRAVRLHGGTWMLKNRPEGGLQVSLSLPLRPASARA